MTEAPTLNQTGDRSLPEPGQLVRVRGQHWLVSSVRTSVQHPDVTRGNPLRPGGSIVSLTSVADDDLGRNLELVWEVEPGRRVVPASELPQVTGTWDEPQRLGAFLDAVRWGTVASADTETLQAPFRAGISIEEYQLEPVARALRMPRVNLLIADDVGLGKTIEAGLVAQEMLLRHRARRMVVVCPAPLTGKWRDEMAEKFGLGFVVLDAEALRSLRRSHGLQANPFRVHPRTIISLAWLRTPRVQRLLDEVLPAQPRQPAFVDLLVVDEAHHCAPPSPPRAGGYATDSRQTRAVRRLAEHSQHRMFLSATPHNGYPESWQALLAMLDPQRFNRGVEPDPVVLRQVMVRRLKTELVRPDGTSVFPPRLAREVEVSYTGEERHAHDLLDRYARAGRQGGAQSGRAGDLMTLLLKKRFFSSPAAFAATLNRRAAAERGDGPVPEWARDYGDADDVFADDESNEQAELELFAAADAQPTDTQRGLLSELERWAQRWGQPADSKATALLGLLRELCCPGGRWNTERIIVFTEYVDTQTWLAQLLGAAGLGGEHLGLLRGGMDPAQRDRLKAAFQASPDRDKVRILLATDAASEGIDLQRHCHRVLHYDIPFNPNRLEQRVGRVDRHGQKHQVQLMHFVGAGWQNAGAGSYEADLEFLSRVAKKIQQERRDLGSINPVLAAAVEARMLGRTPSTADPLSVQPSPAAAVLRQEQNLRAQVAALRAQLHASVQALHVAPANVRRVVDTALALAGQPALLTAIAGGEEVIAPALTGGWERTLTGLADPLDGHARPLVFDGARTEGRDDVVLAHLEHPLVAQATRLLRSAVWGGASSTRLSRVTAVRFDPPPGRVDGVVVAVFCRLVVVGADGTRLHEEVTIAGRELTGLHRSRRLELEKTANDDIRQAVERALDPDGCTAADAQDRDVVVSRWEELTPNLAQDVRLQAEGRLGVLQRWLDQQAEDQARRTTELFAQTRRTLQEALRDPEPRQLRLDDDVDELQRRQAARDVEAWRTRLESLDTELDSELRVVRSRYAQRQPLVFPVAVAVCVPTGAPQ